MTLRNFQVFF